MPFAAALSEHPLATARDRRGRRRRPRPARARRRRSGRPRHRLRHRAPRRRPRGRGLDRAGAAAPAGADRRAGGLGARWVDRGRGDVGAVGVRGPLAPTSPIGLTPSASTTSSTRGVGRDRRLPRTPPRAARCCSSPTLSRLQREFLRRARQRRPDIAVIGGMASAARAGRKPLVLDGQVVTTGAVGVLLDPDTSPIGTSSPRDAGRSGAAHRHQGRAQPRLRARRPAARWTACWRSSRALPPRTASWPRNGLHLGVVVDEHRPTSSRGDFLVRNVLGADRRQRRGRVGDLVDGRHDRAVPGPRRRGGRRGPARARSTGVARDGALLFTCNGRGAHLFGEPRPRRRLVAELLGPRAVAGVFCAGEIGPVGGRNFLHGFTAASPCSRLTAVAERHRSGRARNRRR